MNDTTTAGNACPTRDQLRRMLDVTQVGPDDDAVERHVGQCPDCQRALDELTTPESSGPSTLDLRDPLRVESEATTLGRGGGARPAATPSDALPEVPGYELCGVLGRGGMGIVYRARQVHANRDVALKMVLAGDRGRPEDLLRFRLEAESLARLRHPNIVQVYEVGSAGGRPFFSMEFVEGGTLADRLGDFPPPPEEAAALVETIARGVHAAHQSGVVHRDLKPANILLAVDADGRGVPKVTDFGLAKHVGSDSGLTHTGQILGTPSYMAPEQASGGASVGVLADVYSLGAILYETLTGRPPFKGGSAWETMMQVVHETASPPSRWRTGLPRDLEVICLKCLGKDPSTRYPSADAMAEDLRRFLAGEPILARPAGAIRKAAMWGRRHPAYAAMAALLALAIVGGTVGVAVQWRRAEAHLADSRRRMDLAMRSISAFYTGVSRDVLLEQPEMAGLRARLLRTPLEFYRGLREELETSGVVDRPARLQLAQALISLGRLTQEVGVQGEAEADFRQACEVARALLDEQPGDREALRLLAWGRAQSGKIAAISARLPEARESLAEAVRLFDRLEGEGTAEPEYDNGRGFCRHFLGDVACDEGRYAESEGHYRDSIRIRRKLVLKGGPEATDYLDQLGGTENNLGELYGRSGRPGDAANAFRESVESRRSLAELVPDSTPHQATLASSLGNLAEACHELGREPESRGYLDRSLAIQERIVARHGAVPGYRSDLAATLSRLARSLARDGLWAEAEADYRRAADELGRVVDDDPAVAIWRENHAAILKDLGDFLVDAGRAVHAGRALDRGLATLDRPPAVATSRGTLVRSELLARRGALLRLSGRHVEAEAAFEVARSAAEGSGGGSGPRSAIAEVLVDLAGRELTRRGEEWPAFALADARRAPALLAGEDADESRPAIVGALAASSRALAALGRPVDALADADRAASLAGDGPEASPIAATARAEALAASGRLGEAAEAAASAESAAERPATAIRLARAYARAAGSPPTESSASRAIDWINRATSGPRGEARALLPELAGPAFDALRDRPDFLGSTLDLAFPADPFRR